tara:strand:- start:102 stop:470 length:369 start_codon:yes stop_codon:yes gene_type:complete
MASKFSSSFMYKSPLNGAYTSAAGQGKTYVSTREAIQQLQDDVVTGAKEGDRVELANKLANGDITKDQFCATFPDDNMCKKDENEKEDSAVNMLGKCPKGKVRSKINKKCVSKKGTGKEYDK